MDFVLESLVSTHTLPGVSAPGSPMFSDSPTPARGQRSSTDAEDSQKSMAAIFHLPIEGLCMTVQLSLQSTKLEDSTTGVCQWVNQWTSDQRVGQWDQFFPCTLN